MVAFVVVAVGAFQVLRVDATALNLEKGTWVSQMPSRSSSSTLYMATQTLLDRRMMALTYRWTTRMT